MRFVYCAACICHMLNDWGKVSKAAMGEYILSSIVSAGILGSSEFKLKLVNFQRYDGGVSQHYQMESHGGTTFCALAALQLSDQMHLLSPRQLEKMKRWLLFRQDSGFQGRPNKPIDTWWVARFWLGKLTQLLSFSYSFWIGAALKIVEAFELSNSKENKEYILSCQDSTFGGFSKWPGTTSDPFHTYFGLCGLSFLKEPGLMEVMPSLNISVRAYEYLQSLHRVWGVQSKMSEVQLNID